MIGYYAPNVSPVSSTTPYRHAEAIGKGFDDTLLITENNIPNKIKTLFSETYHIKNGRNQDIFPGQLNIYNH